ncbi:MAG: vitamin B12-dependent ribonucleotide reductase [Candidatus Omnitrophica bacterium]|nr:vitamin B12-dependent ribonucleotide reductase [Candidatus Omnitrophota bacterium]
MARESVKLTENAIRVLNKRYLVKSESGEVTETPKDMFRRVAKNIASADKLYDKNKNTEIAEEEFYRVISSLEFLPNSPTLMNAGRELQQLAACFVLPIEDSMESIFETIKDTAMIHKSGGGTGFSFSRLRPKNAPVKSTGGISSGPVSFMKVFNSATQAVKQGGTRRGANMGILRVDHPDILDFIMCKENDKEITNFNISVGLTEDFVEKAMQGEEYELIEPHTKQPVQKLNAKEVLDLIVKMAWKNGEPGIIFLDRLNKENPTPAIGEIESTNPCGEQPLLPYESCNLGSINLSLAVDEDAKEINWEKLGKTVKIAVHFLDNVIDMNNYPLERISKMTRSNRKIGLGVMGFADMLIKLGVKYNSEEGIIIAEKVMKFILDRATDASLGLAKERGVFPNFEKSIYAKKKNMRLRNATLTTIAPTGSIGIISGCSSGIEPLFALSYVKKILDNERFLEVHPYFEKIAKEKGFYSTELMEKVAGVGSIKDIEEIPADVREVFVTSFDISPSWHIRMQAAFQKYTHNAVSKTVNFPNKSTEKDIKEVYTLACKTGCKGVTVYRDGSRQEQVLNIEKKKEVPALEEEAISKIVPRPRPNVTHGTTTKIATGCGNLYVTINEDEADLPFEVFMQMGKAGGCAMSQLEAIGRLLSLALRSGIEISSIIEQLRGIRCPSPSWEKGGRIFSCSDAIARVIERRLIKAKQKQTPEKELPSGEGVPLSEDKGTIEKAAGSDNGNVKLASEKKTGNIVGVCPDCGGSLWHVEGCMVCRACGYSKCG